MGSTPTRLLLGLIAGALTVLIFHQGMFAILVQTGLIVSPPPPRPPSAAWSMAPTPFWPDLFKALGVGPVSVPRLVNQMVWGGLWGGLFALVYDRIGNFPSWIKGFVFGMIGPMLVGSWLLFAAWRGEPVLAGMVPQRLLVGFLLNGAAFGIGVGLLYAALHGRMGGSR